MIYIRSPENMNVKIMIGAKVLRKFFITYQKHTINALEYKINHEDY